MYWRALNVAREDRLGTGGEIAAKAQPSTGDNSNRWNGELDLGQNRAKDDDLLGDTYEYLIRRFVTGSGKSKYGGGGGN